MSSHSLSRRTFITAAGAVAAGTLAACGAGGGAFPVGDVGLGAPPIDLPAGSDAVAGLEEASQSDPLLWSLTRTDFEAWAGEAFEMRPDAAAMPITLELIDVADRSEEMTPEARELGLREPFSVRFHAPLATDASEGRYQVSHPAMGEVTVHVSDGGTTDDSPRPYSGPEMRVYELHFN